MVNSPLVSVVVPVYKCERYIEKCILSIVGQTYQNLEIIVVIDGTFDRSGEICNQIAKDDKRIVVVEKNNEGVSVARNVGLRLAKGEWISFVDGDDWLEKTYIEDLISIANANRADIVICDYIAEIKNSSINMSFLSLEDGYIDDELKLNLILSCIVSTSITSLGGITNIGVPWGKLYSVYYLRNSKIEFVPGLKRMQDTIFNLHAFNFSSSVYYFHKNLYHYYKNMNSSTVKNMPDFDVTAQNVLKEIDKFSEVSGLDEVKCALYDKGIQLILEMITLKYLTSEEHMSLRKRIKSINHIIYEPKSPFYNCIFQSSGKYLSKYGKIVRWFLKRRLTIVAYLYAYLRYKLIWNKNNG